MSSIGGTAGAIAGGAGGAALGSAILPGVGTYIGGSLGSMAGGFLGGKIGGLFGSNQDAANGLTGNVSPQQQAQILGQVQAPNAVQIAGMPEYQNNLQNLSQQYGQGQPDLSQFGQQYGQMAQSAGQMGQGYGQQMGGIGQQQAALYGQVPQGPDLSAVTANPMAQQQALQAYQQKIAMGQAPSAADQMLQNGMANLGRQTQSGIVSAGGMNPAMAMRQLFQNQSSQGAQLNANLGAQKLQEQGMFGQQAMQGAQNMYGNQFNNAQTGFQNQNTTYGNQMGNLAAQGATAGQSLQGQMAAQSQQHAMVQAKQATVQQTFLNRMSSLNAQRDIANDVFGANKAQASYNQNYQNNVQAFQQWKATQQLQAQKDQAQSTAALYQALIKGGLGAAGAGLQYAMQGGGGGGDSVETHVIDPSMDAFNSGGSGGSSSFVGPPSPYPDGFIGTPTIGNQ